MNEEIRLILECLRELIVQSDSPKVGELAGKIDYLLNPKQDTAEKEQEENNETIKEAVSEGGEKK